MLALLCRSLYKNTFNRQTPSLFCIRFFALTLVFLVAYSGLAPTAVYVAAHAQQTDYNSSGSSNLATNRDTFDTNGSRPRYVYDTANIINNSYKSQIEAYLKNLDKSTSAEVIIYTIPSFFGHGIMKDGVEIHDRDALANYIFNELSLDGIKGIGKTGKDNGILLLFSLQREPGTGGSMRLEVGRGLEGTITDGTAGEILDAYLVPARDSYEKTGHSNFGKAFEDTAILIGSKLGYRGDNSSSSSSSIKSDSSNSVYNTGQGSNSAVSTDARSNDHSSLSGLGSIFGYFVFIIFIAAIAVGVVFFKRLKRERSFLFTWEDVPSNAQEEAKLRQYLSKFAPWAQNAQITKSNDGRTIYVTDKNSTDVDSPPKQATISIDSDMAQATLLIPGGGASMPIDTRGLAMLRIVKDKKNGKRKMYVQNPSPGNKADDYRRRKQDRGLDDNNYPYWAGGSSGGSYGGDSSGGSFSGGGGYSGGAGAGR